MSLPVGISTCVVTFGRATSYLGNDATITGVLSADRTVVHAASGVRVGSGDDVVPNETGFLSFPVPHVDQAGFIDASGGAVVGWLYILTGSIRYASGKVEAFRKSFQVIVGENEKDLDLVPDGPVLPGFTAPTQVFTDGGVAALVTDDDSDTRAALSATFVTQDALDDALAGFEGGSGSVTPPPTPDATWRPAAPTGAERVSGLSFPVVRTSGNYDVTLNGGTGSPTPHRLYFEAEFTGSTTVKVFDDTGAREFVIAAASEDDYATVLEFDSQSTAIVQFQVPAGGMTLKAMSFRQIAAITRYCKLGGDGIAADFSGGSTLTVDVPIKGTTKRAGITWAGNNGSGDIADLRPAYGAQSVFPDSAYIAPFHGRQRNTGSDILMTVGNNDHIFDVYPAASPSTTHELRGDVHGGETSRTDTPAADFTVAYDVLGDGIWRTHAVGAPFRQAARVRITQHTKLETTGGTLLWHFDKTWTIYADGTVRQDRTSVAQAAHRVRDWYYWMVSGDPAKHLFKVAVDGTTRLATVAANDAVSAASYFGGTHSLMYDPAAGVALAIGIDRNLLLGYPLTTPGDSSSAPPAGPRDEDGQLNGELNKLYIFLRLDTEDVPDGYRIDSTQWQKFYAPTDLVYPERDLDSTLAAPAYLTATYPT